MLGAPIMQSILSKVISKRPVKDWMLMYHHTAHFGSVASTADDCFVVRKTISAGVAQQELSGTTREVVIVNVLEG